MISDYQQLPAVISGIAAATETVAIANVLDSGAGGNYPQGRVIRGYLNVTGVGTSTTVVIKCRQGTTVAGTQVGVSQTVTLTVSGTMVLPFSFQDNSAAGAGAYCVTVTFTAGAGNAINDGALEIYAPEPYGSAV